MASYLLAEPERPRNPLLSVVERKVILAADSLKRGVTPLAATSATSSFVFVSLSSSIVRTWSEARSKELSSRGVGAFLTAYFITRGNMGTALKLLSTALAKPTSSSGLGIA